MANSAGQTDLDFASLIEPIGPDAFFADYWEKKPLHIRRERPGFYDGIVSNADLETYLSRPDARYPAVRLARSGSFYPPEAYSRTFKYGDEVFGNVIDIDRVQAEYRAGATIVLPALHRALRPVAALCGRIESFFDHAVHANAYLTPKGVQGFTPHYDGHEAFVLQVAGEKRWQVYPAPIALPHRSQPFSPTGYRPPAPILEITLHPGDLLYLPRGFVHSAATSASASSHMTVGITVYTWIELATELLLSSKQIQAFRQALPPGFASDRNEKARLAETLKELMKTLRDQTDHGALVEAFAARVLKGRFGIEGHFTTDRPSPAGAPEQS